MRVLSLSFMCAVIVVVPKPAPSQDVQTPAAPRASQQGNPEQRAMLEQRLRQRIGQVVRRRLALSDEQFERLSRTNMAYGQERRALTQREREVRLTLREELGRGDGADQARVDRLLDDMIQVQRQRIDVFEREQRDLKAFLTPVQRAQYAAIQERMRRRLELLRWRSEESGVMLPGDSARARWRRTPVSP
jgi:hypothetical protein